MRESLSERYSRWRIEEVLLRYPGLRIMPSDDDGIKLAGNLAFHVIGPQGVEIEDAFDIELYVPAEFPKWQAAAKETGGRIPHHFHKLVGDFLCLGAPTEIQLKLAKSPTVITFVEEFVIPYLFSYSYFEKYKKMPYGELDHGVNGLLQSFATLFGAVDQQATLEFVRLASLRRGFANKYQCPCGSGRRLGKCHNRKVNELRSLLGHKWFQRQLAEIERTF